MVCELLRHKCATDSVYLSCAGVSLLRPLPRLLATGVRAMMMPAVGWVVPLGTTLGTSDVLCVSYLYPVLAVKASSPTQGVVCVTTAGCLMNRDHSWLTPLRHSHRHVFMYMYFASRSFGAHC